MTPQNAVAGRVSLWMAVVAILAAVALQLIVLQRFDFAVQRVCVLIYMAWWAVSFAMGVLGVRARTGKIALAILLLLGIDFVWIGLPHPPHY